ncbi:uncharacterized protein BO97DRAFT_464110 [Aspergillus homomorphus CBS 101889]|uniref:BTB domain-containing protein n=1 Tax=Aspergillus homomorphus (strain CBS 101889) TaxID=1450537 RepID=A0A395I3W6_ASPHC|nr:hypothetical protein BO97DRAFT_464110 [Aspergillus homomorphus CBS 101889]RAL14780.1 hypothetical protein BO97DRAFT_464110 [Aspergillus homomorphus CBS 101889]
MPDTRNYIFDPSGRVTFILTTASFIPQDFPDPTNVDELVPIDLSPAHLPDKKRPQQRNNNPSQTASSAPLRPMISSRPSKRVNLEITTTVAEQVSDEATTTEPQTTTEDQIQASDTKLKFWSPVFEKMFTGAWKESDELQRNGTVTLEIQDWNLWPFLILMQLMHFERHPAKLDIDTLTEVALLADYYQCRKELRKYLSLLLNETSEDIPPSHAHATYMNCLWVSWYPRSWGEFGSYAQLTIYYADGPICANGLPIRRHVLEKLDTARTGALTEIIRRLQESYLDVQQARRRNVRYCGRCDTMLARALGVDLLDDNPVEWPVAPFLGLSIFQLMQTTREEENRPVLVGHRGCVFQFVSPTEDRSISTLLYRLGIERVTLMGCLDEMSGDQR